MWPGGQLWKPGPAYPATVAAWPPAPLFRIRIFCSRGSLTPVAAPNASPNVFWPRPPAGFEEVVSYPCFEGCGLGAKCGNRGRRTRLQRRLGRLCRGFGSGSFGSQTVPVWIVFISSARRSGCLQTQSDALGFHIAPRWGWEGVVRRAASSLWTRGPPDRGGLFHAHPQGDC